MPTMAARRSSCTSSARWSSTTEQRAIFAHLRNQINEYPQRQRVLPGITGWAQINRAYDSSVDDVREKLNYDLEYIRQRSALEDLKIMLLTPAVMLGRRGGW